VISKQPFYFVQILFKTPNIKQTLHSKSMLDATGPGPMDQRKLPHFGMQINRQKNRLAVHPALKGLLPDKR
jgi:hypothetical protein